MSTDAQGAGARTPPNSDRAAELERQLAETRTEARLLRARAALRRLKESAALDYDWVGPWNELLRQRESNQGWYPLGGTSARRHGHFFPFFQTEQQLAVLRDLSRIVVGTNNHAAGMLNGLTSFVIGTGYKLKITPRGANGKALAAKVTDFFEQWSAENQWNEFQQEAFWRHREDGDELIRTFADDGVLKVRHVWAEQLTQPPGANAEEWGYGVRMPDGDSAAPEPEAYWIADVDHPERGEEVPAADVIHLKANTRTGVKRGLPDFSFGTKDALDAAGRLTRNLGEGAAVREAIAFMRQHAAATEADVQAFTSGDADFRERASHRDTYRPVNVWEPGTVVDFPEGMEHAGAPTNPGTAAHASVVQLLLRSAGTRWNAPEWLVSGDASNMGAYTSSLVAESPFVRGVQRAQGYYRARFERVIRRALQVAVAYGLLPAECLTAVSVELVPPSPEVRNKLEEVQRAQTEITLGTDSRQRFCEEQGRDWERIARENQEYQDQFGSPGQQLPGDPFGGAGGDTGGGPGLPLPESEVRASALSRALLESGFTGEITDARGAHRKYVDGKQIAAGGDAGSSADKGGDAKSDASTATKWPDHPVAGKVRDAIAKSNVSAEQKAAYSEAMAGVMGRVPQRGMDRIAAHLSDSQYYESSRELGVAVFSRAMEQAPGDQRAQMQPTLDRIKGGELTIGGCYESGASTKTLHLDGGMRIRRGAGAHGTASQSAAEVYAHELGHAIDGPDHQISAHPKWKEAWDAEIGPAAGAGANARLSGYATKDTHEGFAEFARLVYGGTVPLDRVEKEFPRCSALIKAAKLWPS